MVTHFDAILEDWEENNGKLIGYIYYDTKYRVENGTKVFTVIIDKLSDIKTGSIVKTRNSIFYLGTKKEYVYEHI